MLYKSFMYACAVGEKLVTVVPVAVQVFSWVARLVVNAVQTTTGPVVQVVPTLTPDWLKSPFRSESMGTSAATLAA